MAGNCFIICSGKESSTRIGVDSMPLSFFVHWNIYMGLTSSTGRLPSLRSSAMSLTSLPTAISNQKTSCSTTRVTSLFATLDSANWYCVHLSQSYLRLIPALEHVGNREDEQYVMPNLHRALLRRSFQPFAALLSTSHPNYWSRKDTPKPSIGGRWVFCCTR